MIDDATASAYVKAIETMFSGLPVAEGMNAFAASLVAVVPAGLRTPVEKLGSLSQQSIFNKWITEQLAAHPVGVDLMWFSLSDLGAEVSLCLLRQRRPPKDAHDWDAYDRIAASDVPTRVLQPLKDIVDATTSADTGPSKSTSWIFQTCVPLAWSGLMVAAAMKQLSSEMLLGSDARRRVAVFFAEGDDFLLGEVSTEGFHFFSPPTDSR